MGPTQKIKKAMVKDEIALLLDLIQSNPILTTKETNATSNRTKVEAWVCLTNNFNAMNGAVSRTKEQLKLKWDNLKKAARKRNQQIRMNNLKTGGGKPDYIPPDEILEKVSGLLGSTCTGFEVPFSGDGTMVVDMGSVVEISNVDSDNRQGLLDSSLIDATNALPSVPKYVEVNAETPCRGKRDIKKKIDFVEGITPNIGSSSFLFGVLISKQLSKNKKGKRKTSDSIQNSVITRNLAIASYYEKKKEKLDLEIKLFKAKSNEKENMI